MKKLLIIILCIVLAILLFFSDNIYGYYRFKQFCKNEGGLKVYGKLEKDVGWMTEKYHDALFIGRLEEVKFVRFLDGKDGRIKYDLYYVDGDRKRRKSYEKKMADTSVNPYFSWIEKRNLVHDELRLYRISYEVVDYKTNALLVGFYDFSYSILEQKNTLFGSSSFKRCEKKGFSLIEEYKKLINGNKGDY